MSDDDDEENSENAVEEKKEAKFINYFDPVHVMWEWICTESSKHHISIAILLPSGVLEDDYEYVIIDDRMMLQLTVKWPDVMSSFSDLHYA